MTPGRANLAPFLMFLAVLASGVALNRIWVDGESARLLLLTLIALLTGALTHLLISRRISQQLLEQRVADRTRQLQARERDLEQAQSIAKLGNWSYDLIGDVAEWSAETRRILGVSASVPASFDNFLACAHPDDRPAIIGARDYALTHGHYEVENRILVGDQPRWVRSLAKVTFDPTGRPVSVVGTIQDITATHLMQEELTRSERFSRAVLDALPADICVIDRSGWIVAVNKRWKPFAIEYGLTDASEGIGLNYFAITDYFTGNARADAGKASRGVRAVAAGTLAFFEMECAHPSPTVARWFKLIASPLAPASEAIVIAHFDITDRKLAEQVIDQERLRLDGILRGTNVGTWEWNVQTDATTFNERWAEIIGYRLEELGETDIQTWVRFAHPDDLALSNERLRQHLAGEVEQYECEVRMLHRSGHWVWVLDRGKIVSRDPAGQPLIMAGTHLDITARKQAEELMQESMIVFNHSTQAIIVTDASGTITTVNAAFSHITGYQDVEVIGKRASLFAPNRHNQAYFERVWHALNTNGSWEGEITGHRKNGELYPQWISIAVIKDDQQRPSKYFGLFSDISERKRRQSETLAKDLMDALERERYHLSHELHDEVGQTLTTLNLSLSQSIRMCMHPPQKNCLAGPQRIVADLMADIRGIARRLRPVEIDLLGLRAALREHIDRLARPAAVAISFDENLGEARLPPEIELTCFRVAQEALTNSLRHSGSTQIQVRLTRHEDGIELSIHDNGSGFSLSAIASRVQDASSGLGIIGMRERVAFAGGRFHIDSGAGRGTEIVATFQDCVLSS